MEAKRLTHDEVRRGERPVHVAVAERAIGDARAGLGGRRGIEHRFEWLVLDFDQLESVLGEVPVTCDDDGDRLADVAHRLGCRGVQRDRRVDPGRERP